MSLRLPEHMLEELNLLANKRDVPFQSLLEVKGASSSAGRLVRPLKASKVPGAMRKPELVRFEVEGAEMAVRLAGDREKPTLLLIHGFPSSSESFRNVIEPLARDCFVVAPDLPGFGGSEPVESPSFLPLRRCARRAAYAARGRILPSLPPRFRRGGRAVPGYARTASDPRPHRPERQCP
jgi:hypothetical protein